MIISIARRSYNTKYQELQGLLFQFYYEAVMLMLYTHDLAHDLLEMTSKFMPKNKSEKMLQKNCQPSYYSHINVILLNEYK